MMKKILSMCFLSIAVILLSGCTDSFIATDETLNLDTFLELLEANGFSFEVDEWQAPGFLNVHQNTVHIGDEQLTIYEYDSHEAMLIDASFVGRSGFSIENTISGYAVQISWVSDPYWFKRDLIIVQYTGTNRRIINFLHETLELFAGHGYQ